MSGSKTAIPDQVKLVIEACLLNAEHLLNAAKDVSKPGQNHIAYHLAAMALEEVGKASMITVSYLPPPQPEGAEPDDVERRPIDWIEDHEKKLFWAIWLAGFGRPYITVDEFRQVQALAKHIHELRLATLYVDPRRVASSDEVSDDDLQTLLSLTEARLNLEKTKNFDELEESSREALNWFFHALDDPQLRAMVFSGGSLEKLAELNGNARKWITWLRETIDEMNRTNRELAEKELTRSAPETEEEDHVKWKMKIRLRSWSHSIRPKALAAWNEKIRWIKLFPAGDKDKKEMLVQFAMSKKLPIQGLWPAGMQHSWMFIIALNIGALGYFWWYTPIFVSKYYEEILDIENDALVWLERNPQLTVSWGHRALKEQELSNVAVILTHLVHLNANQRTAFDRYFRALGLLAKNDIFGQFESVIMVEFFEAFRLGLTAYGDWDGAAGTFDEAVGKLFSDSSVPAEFLTDLKQMLQVAGGLADQKVAAKPATLDEVVKMKTYCDLYFNTCAKREIRKQAASDARLTKNPNA